MVGGAAHFIEDARSIDQSGRRALTIAQIQFGLAGRPPRTSRRIVVHALPNLLRRAGTEELHQRLDRVTVFGTESWTRHSVLRHLMIGSGSNLGQVTERSEERRV